MTLIELGLMSGIVVATVVAGIGGVGFYWGRRSGARKPKGTSIALHSFQDLPTRVRSVLFLSWLALGGVILVDICLDHYTISSLSLDDPDVFVATMQKCILAGDVAKAVKLCSASDSTPARVVQAALVKVNRPDEELVQAAEVAWARERLTLGPPVSFWAFAATLLLLAVAEFFLGYRAAESSPTEARSRYRLTGALVVAAVCIGAGASAEHRRARLEATTDSVQRRVLELVVANRQKVDLQGL